MNAQPIVLPCSRCGGACVKLSPPAMDKDARNIIRPLLKLAALKTGVAIELPADGATWFDLIAATPAELSTALQLECAFCARLLEEPMQIIIPRLTDAKD